ncbi:hypothetical protein ZWY2020_004460 [Hordeum vulgare]|nr:hypothetical protein ZWY2020_004457 [Hordeum vulgare]KAI4999871.1 hypothetical protein ZWY2020_004460 [Hordeum vulgare]
MERRPELRRSMTLSEQLSTPDPAIRDFLRIPADSSHLSADAGRTAADGGGSGGMVNWKPLRDRLRLRRSVNAWSSPSEKPSTTDSAGSLKNSGSGSHRSNKYIYAQGEATAAFSRTSSLRQTPTFSRAASTRVCSAATIGRADRSATVVDDEGSEDESEHDEDEEEGKEEAPAAQMSLMALLEQTDSWDEDEDEDEGAGGGASKNAHADDDEDDGEGREEEMVHVCCVCMVRHKGAAFIPCGHTFCRLCSRELWVSRGNCPLCNGFIQEILDIF